MKKMSFFLAALCAMPLFADDSFGGVGVTIIPAYAGAQVEEVIPGAPAAEAGLLPNDKIYAVDGVFLTNDFDASRNAIRGLPGKPVEIAVVRDGDSLSFTLRRSKLSVKEIPTETVQKWYGNTKNEYSRSELETVAVSGAAANESLIGVLEKGYVVSADENVQASNVTAVFAEKEIVFPKVSPKESSAPLRGAAKLRALNRSLIAFSVRIAGNVHVTLTDANGQVFFDGIVSAVPGANHVSWNGANVPSNRYSVRLEQNGSVSTYFAVLR